MNKVKNILMGKKKGFSQIINALVWATMMIVTALLVDDRQITEFLVMLYIAGWFITSGPIHKVAVKK